MKAHMVTLLIVDHDEVGEDIRDIIENTNYPNDCISPTVYGISTIEIGEWHDDHPLNFIDNWDEWRRLFPTLALMYNQVKE